MIRLKKFKEYFIQTEAFKRSVKIFLSDNFSIINKEHDWSNNRNVSMKMII
jgi:hypothetical protein